MTVPHLSNQLSSQITTTSGLYFDGSSFLPYSGDLLLGAVLTVLGLNLNRRQILFRHPHSQALQRHTQSPTSYTNLSAQLELVIAVAYPLQYNRTSITTGYRSGIYTGSNFTSRLAKLA